MKKRTVRKSKNTANRPSKKFWDDTQMKKHLQTYKDMMAAEKVDHRAASKYWEDNIHDPVQSLITWSITLVDKEKSDDEELRAELLQEILHSIFHRVKLDEKANSFSYLTSVGFTRTLNYIAGSSTLKGASFLCDQKIKSYRTVPANTPYNKIALEDGETAYKPCGDIIRVQRFLPRFQTIEEDVEVQQMESNPDLLGNLDFDLLAEYVPDCLGLPKHKEAAYAILDILKKIQEGSSKIEVPKDRFSRWLFQEQLKKALPGKIFKQLDFKLVYAILREALVYYVEENVADEQPIYGYFGLLYPSASEAGEAGDGIA